MRDEFFGPAGVPLPPEIVGMKADLVRAEARLVELRASADAVGTRIDGMRRQFEMLAQEHGWEI